MANTTIPIHKLFRVYETLDQFDGEASHPENKICFIKDKRIIYANGVEYTNEQMYNDNIPASKIKVAIAGILVDEGFIEKYDIIEDGNFKTIRVTSKFLRRNPGYLNCLVQNNREYATSPDGEKYTYHVIKPES